jgi:hypothetical protein
MVKERELYCVEIEFMQNSTPKFLQELSNVVYRMIRGKLVVLILTNYLIICQLLDYVQKRSNSDVHNLIRIFASLF